MTLPKPRRTPFEPSTTLFAAARRHSAKSTAVVDKSMARNTTRHSNRQGVRSLRETYVALDASNWAVLLLLLLTVTKAVFLQFVQTDTSGQPQRCSAARL